MIENHVGSSSKGLGGKAFQSVLIVIANLKSIINLRIEENLMDSTSVKNVKRDLP